VIKATRIEKRLDRLDEKDTIFVLSAQHTGTWFAIDTIREYPEFGFSELNQLADRDWDRPKRPRLLLHAHIGCTPDMADCFPTKPTSPGGLLLDTKFVSEEDMELVVSKYRTIIPVRDPLLALITRHVRHANWSHRHIIHGFKMMAKYHDHKNVFFLPVDGRMNAQDRFRLLLRLMEFTGIKAQTKLAGWASRWQAPEYNVTPPHELKKRYASGDYHGIRRALKQHCDLLEGECEDLGPFLKALGYQDLMWWRK